MAAPNLERGDLSPLCPPEKKTPKQGGWALLTVLLAFCIFVIMMTAALPRASFETQRDREADLIWRGQDYTRAIQVFYRKFRRYPQRLEDLEDTNHIRFLRKRWPDPMAKSTGQAVAGADEWRLLHMGPIGVTDSILAAAGATGSTGAGLGLSLSVMTPVQATTSGTVSGFQSGTIGAALGICGVASKVEKASILTFNSRQKYSEWEFVYDYRKDPLMTNQGQQAGTGARPGVINPPGAIQGVPQIPPQPPVPRLPGR